MNLVIKEEKLQNCVHVIWNYGTDTCTFSVKIGKI